MSERDPMFKSMIDTVRKDNYKQMSHEHDDLEARAKDELLPCPSCGGPATKAIASAATHDHPTLWIVGCDKRCLSTIYRTNAVEVWNRRSVLAADRVRLRGANDPPLCAGHRRLDEAGNLELRFGNDCVACSLNERAELLELLSKVADNDVDSVTALAKMVQFIFAAKEGKIE